MRERLDANGLLDRGAQCAAQRQWTAAIGYITEAIDLGLEEERLPKALLIRGMCSMREGELDSALGDFTSALSVDPSQETAAAAYALKGRCHLKTHQWHMAQSDFSNAIIAGSTDADSYVGRGQSYFKLRELLKGAQDLLEAIRRDPLSADAHYTLGEILLARAEIKQALRMFKIATKAIDAGRLATFALPVPHHGERRLDLTISDLQQAIRRVSDNAAAYAARAESRRQAEKPELAIADFTEALRRGVSNQAECLAHRAYCYMAVRKWNLALRDCNQVIPEDSDNSAARLIRGACYCQAREWGLAIQDFTAAASLKPDAFEPYLLRANCYQAQGQHALAAQDLEMAKTLGWPDA